MSISCFNLLFLIIILRYKSFKSLAANLPPSSGTKGLSSGGMTGKIETIIHSGLLFLSWAKSLTTFNLFKASSLFCFDLVVELISSSSCLSSNKSISARASLIASPPIAA